MEAYLSAEQAAQYGKPIEEVMAELVPLAAQRAVAPISRFLVGAVGQGASGSLYLGFNLEFPGQAFHQTVHAEQFVVVLAAGRGETALTRLAISAAPCGHCRQFLCELNRCESLRITVLDGPETDLTQLIPHRFGPADLGIREPLLASGIQELNGEAPDGLTRAALEAARRSYSPYSGCPAGVALEVAGAVYTGSLLENAAYNPSVTPLQAALVDYYSRQSQPPDIARAVLVETPGPVSQRWATESLLHSLAPGLPLGYSQISQKA